MSKIKTRPFDVSNYLNDEADIAAYLQVAIEDGDPALWVRGKHARVVPSPTIDP